MRHIDEKALEGLIGDAGASTGAGVDRILEKARSLQRLLPAESAALLAVDDAAVRERIFEAARDVKRSVYGSRIVLFAPLYISNRCANDCAYCAFRAGNTTLVRRSLSAAKIAAETRSLLDRGHKRVLLVAGEAAPDGRDAAAYYAGAVRAVYEASSGAHRVRRVNINCAPLSVDGYRLLKASGIGTYQIFQETYHDATYRRVHPSGPKSDPDNRLDAVDRAFRAGIDDIGIGVLYGLYDYRFETLALLSHIDYLERTFGVGPHTISVPRLEPALGSPLSTGSGYRLTDDQFRLTVAVLRLSVPYTGIILSTRETPAMRDELFSLGVSQVSAGSSTAPGGYAASGSSAAAAGGDEQFSLADHRSLDEVIASLIERGAMPSFCTACYRSERTGAAFMQLARPGTIKGKCKMNALITLKEYLDDFASPAVKEAGYRLIGKARAELDTESVASLERFFADIDRGARDGFV